MNDGGALRELVTDETYPAYKAAGESAIEEKRALYVRINQLLLVIVAALSLALVAVSLVTLGMFPLQKLIPLIARVDTANRIVEFVRDQRELADNERQDAVTSVIWTFARNREAYHYHGATDHYDLVLALTSGAAHDDYIRLFQNAESPERRIGDSGGYIQFEQIPSSMSILDELDACIKKEFCKVTYSFWLTEKLSRDQAAGPRQHYTATASFIFVDRLPAGQRGTFNPAAIKIIDYYRDCDNCRGA